MFDDVDLSLKSLLDDTAAPEAVRDAEVDFRTPGRDYAPAQETLNLFLTDVVENGALRDAGMIIERAGGEMVRRRPPFIADCRYLITGWASPDTPVDLAWTGEHRLLGETLRWLAGFPALPAVHRKGGLRTQPDAPPMLVAHPAQGRRDEFWASLHIAPRLALDLCVTVAFDLDAEVPEGPPVTTHALAFPPAAAIYTIAGEVRAADGLPVAVARVVLEPLGHTAVTDGRGRFVFGGVPAGDYRLHTTSGARENDTGIRVPAIAANGYDVTLT
ncbi:hypothetical protein Ait01nite_081960 [Actinoplanes italicus]|uniref:Carboxypeptidase family protein n=1 Tax=Actinoplanes italicus TaxID=113567 RepID=A0A2T0K354_9ACTN|nr:Pvc16 family protein [Actinoplanes italicus]PRX17292.1 carboxypeptidase family protein [Actinoplanes italicus]GIE35151.1 hypothetical protein Ait01nite_081960 [Actinoplanes italicus]